MSGQGPARGTTAARTVGGGEVDDQPPLAAQLRHEVLAEAVRRHVRGAQAHHARHLAHRGLELAQLSGATGGVVSSGTIMIGSGDGARSGGAARRGAARRGGGRGGEGPAARCAATR